MSAIRGMDAHDQDAILGLAVVDRMACGLDLAIVGLDIARVAPKVWKFRQHSERFVQPNTVLLGPGEAPSLQGERGNRLDVRIGFAR